MRFSKIQLIIIGLVLVVIVVGVLIFTGVIPGLHQKKPEVGMTGAITVWGVFDSPKVIEDTLIADFIAANPNASVTYRQFTDARVYEQALLNALAAGTGPDVFMIQNIWIPAYADKLLPLTSAQLGYSLSDWFPKVVIQDFSPNGLIYGLPLYIDTLATFYNRDLLDASGVAQPPTTWEEFVSLVPTLRQLDATGRVQRAAAAIGGSNDNIDRASDLVSLILLQQLVPMVNDDFTKASFATLDGINALRFYTQFAQPASQAYTWDPGFPQSIDAFTQNKVAMIFSYNYEIALLKQKNPFLNFAVAPMLQFANSQNPVNFANYWGLAVSKQSRQPALAWSFIQKTAGNVETAKKYLALTGRPPALRDLITEAISRGGEGAIFARQALTATSWFQVDGQSVGTIFSRMIESIINGQLSVDRALRQAQEQVTAVLSGSRLPSVN